MSPKWKGLNPVKTWTPAKVKAFTEAAMALGAMIGVSQLVRFHEVRLKGIKHAPIYLLYAADFQHGITWREGQISHHSGLSEPQIVAHLTEWAEAGAVP